ncbi:uncharacterized protein TNCV_3521221 [Trichonephila clavipes]|nr:uncharacterized protein TNCV_3521221 [Trichonephila clavipes]
MPDHTIFQWLHRQLCETHSFHVTRHDAGRRRAVQSPSLEESILNGVADRPESSSTSLNSADYLLRLPVGRTTMCAAAGLYSLCVEQL